MIYRRLRPIRIETLEKHVVEMRLQIASDLHLERPSRRRQALIPRAPYLALLGDIGNPASEDFHSFLSTQCASFERVLFVPGNHEYWSRPVTETVSLLERYETIFENFTLMNKTTCLIEDTLLCGCTLWSEIRSPESKHWNSDFRHIPGWTVDTHNAAHYRDKRWLEITLKNVAIKTVVLTHHAPCLKCTSRPEHHGSPMGDCYAADLTYLFRPPVMLFAHGHTHHNHESSVEGCRVVANQLGYNDEPTVQTFRPDFVVDI